MPDPGFVHLRLHTEYSVADGLIRIPELIESVVATGMPAIAVTDQVNLFALVKFYGACQAAGVKPLVGADLRVDLGNGSGAPAEMVLLCRNIYGYRNLARLVSRAYTDGLRSGSPVVDLNWLSPESVDGLVALSGGVHGLLGSDLLLGRTQAAGRALDRYLELFGGHFCVEVQRTGRTSEEVYLDQAVNLAVAAGATVVATNDVRFLRREDFDAHEARVCIQSKFVLADRERPRLYTEQQYLRSAEEMAELFQDIPAALENTVQIAKLCNLSLELGTTTLPDYQIPEELSPKAYLEKQARAGLDQRLGQKSQPVKETPYRERLESELDVICRMGFPGYFLIVADFIRWAREADIPVGPGRGSGAGSLVAWAMGITDLDPLQHELLFERFLNPERISMPDFDIDFCMEKRDQVIEYVADRYGRDRVAQIITFGKMKAKAVVRDVGRVLGLPYGQVDAIAKLIPVDLREEMTLARALKEEADLRSLYEDDEDVRSVIDLARSLEGLVRSAGTHAAGVVIAPSALTDFTPLYQAEPDTELVTQFDMGDVEAVGLVKFDFLGLRTLTIINRAVETVNRSRSAEGEDSFDIGAIPMDDPETFRLLQSARTGAVFQLESRGMRDLIKRLRPDSFDEIVALVALFRPGPLESGMVDDYISRKHAESSQPIEHLHPDLAPVLENTHGVILYQEQVMQIAQRLAGYSLGEADLLRRAMGKKKPEEMARQRSVFVEGAGARGVPQAAAERIFDVVEKFAGYGFNKSHSAAYALIAYQTAWLKAHYPAAFMAACMSTELSNTDKLETLKDESLALGVTVLGPDVNLSEPLFSVTAVNAIRYGLSAVKGFGSNGAEEVCRERSKSGPFRNLVDFLNRLEPLRIGGSRAIESLINAGALDSLGPNRATMVHNLPRVLRHVEQLSRDRASGQVGLFSESAAEVIPEFRIDEQDDWLPGERLAREKDSLGFYLSGHPFDQYRRDGARLASSSIASVLDLRASDAQGRNRSAGEFTVAGLVREVKRRGRRVTAVLDDGTGRMEAHMFREAYDRFRSLLAADAILVMSGELRFDEFSDAWILVPKEVQDIDRMIEARALKLLIRWDGGPGLSATSLQHLLDPFRPGSCEVAVYYSGSDAEARLELGDEWMVRPCRELRERLLAGVGAEDFRFVYDQGVSSPPS